jgi:hypothetical protein
MMTKESRGKEFSLNSVVEIDVIYYRKSPRSSLPNIEADYNMILSWC